MTLDTYSMGRYSYPIDKRCDNATFYGRNIQAWSLTSSLIHDYADRIKNREFIKQNGDNPLFQMDNSQREGLLDVFKALTSYKHKKLLFDPPPRYQPFHLKHCEYFAVQKTIKIVSNIFSIIKQWFDKSFSGEVDQESYRRALVEKNVLAIFPEKIEDNPAVCSNLNFNCSSPRSQNETCYDFKVFGIKISRLVQIRTMLSEYLVWFIDMYNKKPSQQTWHPLIQYPIIHKDELLYLEQFKNMLMCNKKRNNWFSTCPIFPYSCQYTGHKEILSILSQLARILSEEHKSLKKGWTLAKMPPIFLEDQQLNRKNQLDLNERNSKNFVNVTRNANCPRKWQVLKESHKRSKQRSQELKQRIQRLEQKLQRSNQKVQGIKKDFEICQVKLKDCKTL